MKDYQFFGKDDIEKIFICYLAYIAIALYKNQIGVNGWEGVREGLDEMGRIMRTITYYWGREN